MGGGVRGVGSPASVCTYWQPRELHLRHGIRRQPWKLRTLHLTIRQGGLKSKESVDGLARSNEGIASRAAWRSSDNGCKKSYTVSRPTHTMWTVLHSEVYL